MIALLILLVATQPVDRLLDRDLTTAQRNDACHELRGNKSPDVIEALHKALDDAHVQACAGANLGVARAVEVLNEALASPNARVRGIAARELGALHPAESLELIANAAHDSDPLVASAAVQALIAFPPAMSRPALLALAREGGPIGLQALHATLHAEDAEALPIARKLLKSKDVGDLITAINLLAKRGDATDLPVLREFAKRTPQDSYAPGRGFGLLPAVNVSAIAKSAIASIESRLR